MRGHWKTRPPLLIPLLDLFLNRSVLHALSFPEQLFAPFSSTDVCFPFPRLLRLSDFFKFLLGPFAFFSDPLRCRSLPSGATSFDGPLGLPFRRAPLFCLTFSCLPGPHLHSFFMSLFWIFPDSPVGIRPCTVFPGPLKGPYLDRHVFFDQSLMA